MDRLMIPLKGGGLNFNFTAEALSAQGSGFFSLAVLPVRQQGWRINVKGNIYFICDARVWRPVGSSLEERSLKRAGNFHPV
jgi:hypothetical protein